MYRWFFITKPKGEFKHEKIFNNIILQHHTRHLGRRNQVHKSKCRYTMYSPSTSTINWHATCNGIPVSGIGILNQYYNGTGAYSETYTKYQTANDLEFNERGFAHCWCKMTKSRSIQICLCRLLCRWDGRCLD